MVKRSLWGDVWDKEDVPVVKRISLGLRYLSG